MNDGATEIEHYSNGTSSCSREKERKLFYPYLGRQSYTDTITNTDTDKELSITASAAGAASGAQSKQALI